MYGLSGHVQVPVKTAQLLANSGYDIYVITSSQPGNTDFVSDIPKNMKVLKIVHPSKSWPQSGIKLKNTFKNIFQLIVILNKNKFDIIHMFGGSKTGLVAGLISFFNIKKTKVIYTPTEDPFYKNTRMVKFLKKTIYKNLNYIVSNSEYLDQSWGFLATAKRQTIYPGVFKVIPDNRVNSQKNCVLFWRNADHNSGTDIMISIVKQLAPEFKDIKFVFAVRPGSEYQNCIINLASEYDNVFAYIAPYKEGISLDTLLQESLFCVFPYRHLTINPQVSILETLLAGVPVIISDVESNYELIQNGLTGFIVENNIDEYLAIIRLLLNDKSRTNALSRNVARLTADKYDWDKYIKSLTKYYKNIL